MNKKEIFYNKTCQVTYNSGFTLRGKVIGIDDAGIILETDQKTSFISWIGIRDIVPLEG